MDKKVIKIRTPKLLVSIKNVDEVYEAVEGGADIVDIKDPNDGSLGLPDLEVVRDVIKIVRSLSSNPVSIALGDIRRYSKYLSYLVFASCVLGVDYIKIGIAMENLDEALYVATKVADISKMFSRTNVVLVGYADYININSIEPLKVVDIALKTGAKGVMIDTFEKKSLSTFDILSVEYLKTFVKKAQDANLLTAIAGSLKLNHIPLCVKLGFDVIGVRGAVCIGNRNGKVSKELVKMFKVEIAKTLQNIR
jgi:uncharacterized protein (UPF0264 family)